MNIRNDLRPNLLMVGKDWGSTVLWGRSSSGKGMANYSTYEQFGLPSSLIERFDYWSAWYEKCTPEKISEDLDWAQWSAYGLALAIDLKRVVAKGGHSR